MNLNYRFGLPLIMTFCALSPLSAQRPVDPTRPLFSPPQPSISCGLTIFPGRQSVIRECQRLHLQETSHCRRGDPQFAVT